MVVLYSSIGFIREPLMRYRIHPAQQIGLASTSLRERFLKAHRAGNVQYRALEGRFENLRERLLEHPGLEQTSCLQDLDRKIQFLHFQANLANNRITRLGQILTALPSYMRYTRGLATISRDFLV
jgi:hypothetical protein